MEENVPVRQLSAVLSQVWLLEDIMAEEDPRDGISLPRHESCISQWSIASSKIRSPLTGDPQLGYLVR